jgi:hypothetical protein
MVSLKQSVVYEASAVRRIMIFVTLFIILKNRNNYAKLLREISARSILVTSLEERN